MVRCHRLGEEVFAQQRGFPVNRVIPSTLNLSPSQKKEMLAQLLRQKAAAPQTAPLSCGQQSLWVAQQVAPSSAVYNEAHAWRICSEVDVPALERAFQALTDRHAVLRTTYPSHEGAPIQQIHATVKVPFELIDASLWASEELARRLTHEAESVFDLTQQTPLRVRLFRRGPSEYVLLLVMHHIAMDLWSLGVMLDDLRELYAAERTGVPARMAAPQADYAAFCRFQAEMLAGPEGERLASYWRQQLAGGTPELVLPTDRPRPAVRSYNGASLELALDDALADQLRRLARAEGVTLYATLLAAFQVLLHRYSGQDDIRVGSPTAGRTRSAWRRTLGYFVNPVVLRADLAGNPTFRDFLAQVRRTVAGALGHQHYPFPLLVEQLEPVRDRSRSPLFQAHFAWEKPAGVLDDAGGSDGPARFDMGELVLEALPLQRSSSQFELTLMVLEAGRSLSATLQYNTDLWDEDSIARMAGHYRTLLESIVAAPSCPVGELPLLTDQERQQLLVEWNATDTPYPADCLHRLIEAQVEKTPDVVALLQGETTLTYRELNEQANRLARHLRSLGVGPEVRVGLWAERSPQTFVAILAVLKAGGAHVPLDPAYPQDRLAFMLADIEAPLVLVPGEAAQEWLHSAARVVRLADEAETIAGYKADNLDGGAERDSLAYVIYTSGSTGQPKGVLVTHRGLGNLAQAMNRVFGVTVGSRLLQFASLSFDASMTDFAMTLTAGATLVLAPPQVLLAGPALAELLRQQAINIVTLPPSVLAGMPTDDLPELHTVAAAGEACPAEIVARWAPGRRFINAYGPTENTVCSSMAECRPDGSKPSIGPPMDNVRAYVLDSRQQLLPAGVPGELYLGGVGLARGYHNRPELTAEKFVANPFGAEPASRLYRTGDRVRWLPDGRLDFLGRIDRQVKVRGFRIELGEVEAALAAHPSIDETAAVVHDRGEARLVAYYVADALTAPNASELRHFLKDRLPEYMVPSAFVRMDAFPLTPNGKVDRKALPAPEAARPDLLQAYVAPQNAVQETLAGIVASVLGLEKVGIHDSFFDLGGASLQAVQVVERANQQGIPLTPELLFQYTTVVELEGALAATSLPPSPAQLCASRDAGGEDRGEGAVSSQILSPSHLTLLPEEERGTGENTSTTTLAPGAA
jgi:amino acid adenylation domain-containing protein